MGFLTGHARKLADYLGANVVDDGPRAPPKAEVDAITAANMVAQQSAAMVAVGVSGSCYQKVNERSKSKY